MEENKLIAEFMGREYVDENLIEFKNFSAYKTITLDENGHPDDIVYTDCFDPDNELEYHTSWDWLMPVITNILEKCSELDDMERYHCIIDQIPQIDHTYKAVVEFIKWYNKNK